MTYMDMTFCALSCKRTDCKRNQKNIPKGAKHVSLGAFINCEDWVRDDEQSGEKAVRERKD